MKTAPQPGARAMTPINRRRVVTDFALAALLGSAAGFTMTARKAQAAKVGLRPSEPLVRDVTSPISIELKFANGKSLQFSEDKAVALAPYVDPRGAFTQLCRMASVAGSPFTVFFRPDEKSSRVEVVVELGWLGRDPANVGAYVATISRSGNQLARVNVPEHYWWARWRWQSERRPVRKTSEELQKAALVPKFDAGVVAGQKRITNPDEYRPMSFPGLSSGMADTGERPEIGLLTDVQAEWLCTESAAALEQLIVQAEAHASVPVHVRDETMGPISIQRYPTASSFWDPAAGNADPSVAPAPRTFIEPNKGHYPSLAFVPFLLTGDPYYLEEVQFTAQAALLDYNTDYRKRDKGVLGDEEPRGWAWSVRSMFQAVLATGDNVPSWLAPRAYFERVLDHNLNWFVENHLKDRNPLKSACHFAVSSPFDEVGPWQQDFLTATLGWAVAAGFAKWRPVYEWQARQAIGRARGEGGYPKSQAIQYFLKTDGATDWRSLARVNGLTETPDGGFPESADANYAAYLRGALVIAEQLKLEGAREALDYVDGQVELHGWLPYKWAFARR